MSKKELREAMLLSLSGLSEEMRKAQDKKISDAVMLLPELCDAECVFAYVGTGYEIGTREIIEKMLKLGKRVSVPLCHGKGEMDAVEIKSLSELSLGRYGIPEPKEENPKLSPSELDAIIVPGVAFDTEGKRLGRGGGYYDRFIAKAENAVSIALCREINLIEAVPAEEHDRAVDMIVTEARVIDGKER